MFVADDLGAWLVEAVADAVRRRLTKLVLGTDQQRALRRAATSAVELTSRDLHPDNEGKATELAMAVSQVFGAPVPDLPSSDLGTLLEALQIGITGQLAVLDDADLTGTGQSAAQVLGVSVEILVNKLTDYLEREILADGARGGPLAPLANQLNHDVTHLQLARLASSRLTQAQAKALTRRRVTEASPRELGVHAAIQVDGACSELPVYVTRDVDAPLRRILAAGIERGCFVLLIGGSSVGKTRTLYEAVLSTLPDWWLIHPDPAEAGAFQSLLEAPPTHTVVWLDELQRYLHIGGALTAGTVRALLAGEVILAGTMWPDEYANRAVRLGSGDSDHYAADRDLLKLAQIVDISSAFSTAELTRARELSAADPRISRALETADAGLTQVLAAGPELVRRWEQAPTPYGRALITAAVDARRLGFSSLLTSDLLGAAVHGYLTSAQRATAPGDWLDQALAYATAPLLGATSAIEPVDDGSMGGIAGFTVADFLLQHARRTRRVICPPASLWASLESNASNDDLHAVAFQAKRRMRYGYAEHAYKRLAGAGDHIIAQFLIEMLAGQGRTSEALTVLHEHMPSLSMNLNRHTCLRVLVKVLLQQRRVNDAFEILRARAQSGDWAAADWLVDLLAEHGRIDELRQFADIGYSNASVMLARHLAERGLADELRIRVDAGDRAALYWLPEALVRVGRFDELKAHALSRYPLDEEKVTDVLIEQGRIELAIDILQQQDVTRGYDALGAKRLVSLLASQRRVDEIRRRAHDGDHAAVGWLVENGDISELRILADAGHFNAKDRLAGLLAEQGNVDELRARADAGDHAAASRLPVLLAAESHVDELYQILDGGNRYAAAALASVLVEEKRVDEAIEVMKAGNWHVAQLIAKLLLAQGLQQKAIEVMEIRASTIIDYHAYRELIDLVVELGRFDKLEAYASEGLEPLGPWANVIEKTTPIDTFKRIAGDELDKHLAGKGLIAELWTRADQGSWYAKEQLSELLAANEQVEDLRRLTDNLRIAKRLAGVLVKQGRVQEAIEVLEQFERASLREPASNGHLETFDFDPYPTFAELLAMHGRLSDLSKEVDAGTEKATDLYVSTLAELGHLSPIEAERLRAYGLDADGSFRISSIPHRPI